MDTSLSLGSTSLPTLLMVASTIIFLALERAFPGRQLPHSRGWYGRAILINLCQLGITLALARVWIQLFGDTSLLKLSGWTIVNTLNQQARQMTSNPSFQRTAFGGR